MKIRYEFGGDDNEAGEPFTYVPDDKSLSNAIKDCVKKEVYGKFKDAYGNFFAMDEQDQSFIDKIADLIVDDYEMADTLCETYRDELTERFESDAENEWRN